MFNAPKSGLIFGGSLLLHIIILIFFGRIVVERRSVDKPPPEFVTRQVTIPIPHKIDVKPLPAKPVVLVTRENMVAPIVLLKTSIGETFKIPPPAFATIASDSRYTLNKALATQDYKTSNAGPGVQQFGGMKVPAKSVIILLDDSESMIKINKKTLQYAHDSLPNAPIVDMEGSYVLSGDSIIEMRERFRIPSQRPIGLVDALMQNVNDLSFNETTTVIVISDFDDPVDEGGLQQLLQLSQKYHLRLYLNSVGKVPDARLLDIARDTNGTYVLNNSN